MGRRKAGFNKFTVYASELDGASSRPIIKRNLGHGCLVRLMRSRLRRSRSSVALCGSSQLLRIVSCSRGHRPLRRPFPAGPQAPLGCGHLQPGKQGWDPKQIPRMLCLRDHRTSHLLAVRASLSSPAQEVSTKSAWPLPLLSPLPPLGIILHQSTNPLQTQQTSQLPSPVTPSPRVSM